MRGLSRRGRARAIAVLGTGLVLAGAMATLAHGELTSKGNLFVTFNGGIEPIALPRHERAPITVWMDGKVRTLKGADPPSLSSITIALNRAGHLETKRPSEVQEGRTDRGIEAAGPGRVPRRPGRERHLPRPQHLPRTDALADPRQDHRLQRHRTRAPGDPRSRLRRRSRRRTRTSSSSPSATPRASTAPCSTVSRRPG